MQIQIIIWYELVYIVHVIPIHLPRKYYVSNNDVDNFLNQEIL